jgi:hypothetical protein
MWAPEPVRTLRREKSCVVSEEYAASILRVEDGGDMFLRNDGWLSMDYTAFYPLKTEPFITTAVQTSNPTRMLQVCKCRVRRLEMKWWSENSVAIFRPSWGLGTSQAGEAWDHYLYYQQSVCVLCIYFIHYTKQNVKPNSRRVINIRYLKLASSD